MHNRGAHCRKFRRAVLVGTVAAVASPNSNLLRQNLFLATVYRTRASATGGRNGQIAGQVLFGR